jgi:Asp-tRNA(Asn)/Glu-tRNA(Gln) amidotransferase A subunit family amidase
LSDAQIIDEYTSSSFVDLLTAFRAKKVSPVEAMQGALAQYEKANPQINALFAVDRERAIEESEQSEQRWAKGQPKGPLDGIPITVKDSIKVAGMPYWRGCRAYMETENPTEDAPPAARLKEAGAVIFAKTTQPDLGMLASGISSAHGIVRNPWNTEFSPGGSSSGAGASVAACITAGSIGTDIAGSVRGPAAHNGLFGMKPTAGRVPHSPPDTMRSAGPLTRSVTDGAVLMDVLSGADDRDYTAIVRTDISYQLNLNKDLKGLRIGLIENTGFGPTPETDVAANISQAAVIFEALGANIEIVKPAIDFDLLAEISKYFSTRTRLEYLNFSSDQRNHILPYIGEWSQKSEHYSAIELFRIIAKIDEAKANFLKLANCYDYLITPTLPVVRFSATQLGPDPEAPLDHLNFNCLSNQTGQPAASICCGFSSDGLPIGLQIIGRRFDDLGVLQMSYAFEQARDFTPDWPA